MVEVVTDLLRQHVEELRTSYIPDIAQLTDVCAAQIQSGNITRKSRDLVVDASAVVSERATEAPRGVDGHRWDCDFAFANTRY